MLNPVLLVLDVGLAVDAALAELNVWGPPLAVLTAAAAVAATRTGTVRTLSAARAAWPLTSPLTCPDTRPDTSADARPDTSGRDPEGGS